MTKSEWFAVELEKVQRREEQPGTQQGDSITLAAGPPGMEFPRNTQKHCQSVCYTKLHTI
jgi:hypothetical protein